MATRTWRGGASAVKQVTTISFSAYTSGETYTLEVNGKTTSYTATASTEADVLGGLAGVWNAETDAEFVEAVAAYSSTFTLTSRTAGIPFTVTASATGAITSTVTETTAATGPNHFDNANNWVSGTAPTGTDDLVLKDSSFDILYGMSSTNNFASVDRQETYTGNVGLTAINASGYPEYRNRRLKYGSGAGSTTITVRQGQGSQSPRFYVDVLGNVLTADVYGGGVRIGNEEPVQFWNADTGSAARVYGGSVLLAADSSATFASVSTVQVDGTQTPPNVRIGDNVAGGAISVRGGSVLAEDGASATSADVTASGTFRATDSVTCPTVTAGQQGRVFWESSAGITTQATVQPGGIIDFSRSSRTKAVQAITVHAGGTVHDPGELITWTTDIVLTGCRVQDVTLDLGRDITIGVS